MKHIREVLSEKGLKITPQRISILEAIYSLQNHPTADNIIEYIRKSHPNIATGTVYKVLETLCCNRFKFWCGITNSRHTKYLLFLILFHNIYF